MKKICLLLIFIISTLPLLSQRDEINKYLLMAARGETAQVKDVMLELLAKYPNEPGVKLLHATIIENAYLAMDIYKQIVKDAPNSEWADDAQWRIVQFYAIVGDTTQAKKELDMMRNNYSNSPFLASASEVVRLALGVAKSEIRSTMDFSSIRKEQRLDVSAERNEVMKSPNINKVAEKPKDIPVDKSPESVKNESKSPVVTDTQKNHSEPVKPKETVPVNGKSNSNTQSQSDEQPFYGLQVGIYQDKESAEEEKNKFLAQRMRTQVVEKKIDNKSMFAVVIGHYSSMESAEAAKIIVAQQCKCEPIIYKK